MDRRKQLEKMTVLGELSVLARNYNLDIDHLRKGQIIDAILAHENATPEPKEVKRRPPRNAAQTKLKALRVSSGLKQKDVAEKAGVKLPVYSQYEQGIRPIDGIKIVSLIKICNALNCSLEDILEDQETLAALKEYNN